MKCLVTGVAGFIGSHLAERLLAEGHTVIGVDAFIPYYPRQIKESNLSLARTSKRFLFHNLDLRTDPIEEAIDDVDAIYHLAAMPGLAKSWTEFDLYQSCNLGATQRLLEAARHLPHLHRFIYASTSSVYGKYSAGDETLPTKPTSPYGVTKLASEQLCRAYQEFGLPVVVLRYFSVYGPRQRPDMGYHRFIRALLDDQPITMFGDGQQVRGNTYIADCIEATVRALRAPIGETYNVGGGETASVWDILRLLENMTGKKGRIERHSARAGDQRQTFADTSKIYQHLGWKAGIDLEQGLLQQIAWQHQARLPMAA